VLTTCYYTFVTAPRALTTLTSEENTGARESLWKVGTKMFVDHPIGGVGAGNFVVVERNYTASNINLPRIDQIAKGELVHNSYLQVAAELGTVGLFGFLAILAAALAASLAAARTFSATGDRELELLARGLFLGTLGMLVAYFFATNQYEKQLWLMLGLGPASLAIARRQLGARLATGSRRAPRRAGV